MDLAKLQREAATVTELDLVCETCHAKIGVPCSSHRRSAVPPHDARRRALIRRKVELHRLIEWEYQCCPPVRAPEVAAHPPILAGGPS